ncbi:MAG: Na-translocating system protein MpsC family protein [Nitrospirota bacterium]
MNRLHVAHGQVRTLSPRSAGLEEAEAAAVTFDPGATDDAVPRSLDAFIRDRFRTTLEEKRTARRNHTHKVQESPTMKCAARTKAEIEYAVMLAVLNFQTEFMKSSYTRAQVRVSDHIIEVTLTRSAFIPAEERLAQSQSGRALLEQVYTALFKSGESLLRAELEKGLGVKVHQILVDFDVLSGTHTILFRLAEPLHAASPG